VAQVGRISGAVLKDNLLRQGIDLAFESDLIYLKVDPNRDPPFASGPEFDDGDPNYQEPDIGSANIGIGVNTNAPNSTLDVNAQLGTTNLEASYLNVSPNIEINNNSITAVLGNLNFNSADEIVVSTLETQNLRINDNTISTTDGSNLEIRPNGNGQLIINSNWKNWGDIHATGDITFGGNLTLGDDDTDSVTFESDVNSDIIPDVTGLYNLGSQTKKWQALYTNQAHGETVNAEELLADEISLSRRQGNVFYVSTLGDNTNVGDHQHGAFRTLEHALDVVDASSGGPVTIHIFPGEYEEAFPLVVPENVSISGEDLRNVIVKPTNATSTNNAFELTHNTTIENITIKDFYAPGYAFVFQNGAIISERSPYIRNVTVITQGSFTYAPVTDIYDAGDAAGGTITDTFDGGSGSTEATDILDGLLGTTGTVPGGGAYIDGSVLDSATLEGSMLFHSCTFITPGVDCIIMTNGVRVEWLNCFTYYATVGLKAEQGTSSLGDNGVRYGSELRSINSANIYGNYGAVANGADTLMYLIQHNFAYIGSGVDTRNDPSLALQDQETVELNNGKIYYVTTDHAGAFRVGDAFFVNFEDGTTSLNIGEVSLQDVSAIYINTNGNITYIDGERISTGNIRFSGNTISTVDGDLIWHPDSTEFLISTNDKFIIPKGDTGKRKETDGDIRWNTDFNIYEGYGESNVTFNGIFSQDRLTSITADQSLDDNLIFTAGATEMGRLVPGTLQFNSVQIDDVNINNNIIKSSTANTDLLIPNSVNENVTIDNIIISASSIDVSTGQLNFSHTGQGYLKFNTTGGLVIPAGDSSNRHQNPEVGTVRFNSDVDSLEIWSGTAWVNVIEDSEGATEADMQEFLNLYVLVLG